MNDQKMARAIALLTMLCLLALNSTQLTGAESPPPQKMHFQLVPDWDQTNPHIQYVPGMPVDVNLGHTPASFLAALWYQMIGRDLPAEKQTAYQLLFSNNKLRRIDVALRLASDLNLQPKFTYSDPWTVQTRFLSAPVKKVKRDLGAVCMYFFHCPNGVNGTMSWANNHAPGMASPASVCRMQPTDNGYYTPSTNAGFWFMELLDAHYAGLQFFLLNTYGPDITDGSMQMLNNALAEIDRMGITDGVKIGLFDDTWIWGKPHGGIFSHIPDMSVPAECARLIFEGKWKPFFHAIPRKYWYFFRGRPLIYFYNGGTLLHRNDATAVFHHLKKLFLAEFGVEPFLCADTAFSGTDIMSAVDQQFQWFQLSPDPKNNSRTMNGSTLAHAMVRWDSLARENKNTEKIAAEKDLLHKDDALLTELLNQTHDVDLLVIATWNDLGEGTGINRCYDYFWGGDWKTPTHFMELIRSSQSGDFLTFQNY